jgi:hypothetical protein
MCCAAQLAGEGTGHLHRRKEPPWLARSRCCASPYFSGRFGVNASNVNAHFTCLQANATVRYPALIHCLSTPPSPLPLPH